MPLECSNMTLYGFISLRILALKHLFQNICQWLLKDHEGESIDSLLRMVFNVEVHIRMTKLVKTNIKRKKEISKAKANLKSKS